MYRRPDIAEHHAMTVSWKVLALSGDRAGLAITFCAMSVAAVVEIAGVASVASFVSYIGNPIATPPIARIGVDVAAFGDPIVALGLICFAALLASNVLQATTTHLLLRFTWSTGATLAGRVFEASLARSYQQHIETHSSESVVKVLHDVHSAIANVLIPTLSTIARLMSALAILALLMWVDLKVSLIALLVAAGSYTVVFLMLAAGIARLGKRSYAGRLAMYKIASDVFAAIAEVKVFRAERIFLDRFAETSQASAESEARSQMMRQLPRYLVETIAFGGMVVIVVATAAIMGPSDALLPLLSIYAVAAWRLLPAAQQIFSNVTSIRHHWPSVEAVSKLLTEPASIAPTTVAGRDDTISRHLVDDEGSSPLLEFRSVDFGYKPGQSVLSDHHLRIDRGETVGIIGRSGAGKTTFLALCLGLLAPRKGEIFYLGFPHSANSARRIGYVPQFPRFFDDTIRFNITLGDDAADGDEKIWSILRSTDLADVISRLPAGLETKLGEQGSGLSGGQLQRLALARALHVNPEFVVLDEFTSSLDAVTEQSILGTLRVVLKDRTALIVTHRREVLEICTRVVRI